MMTFDRAGGIDNVDEEFHSNILLSARQGAHGGVAHRSCVYDAFPFCLQRPDAFSRAQEPTSFFSESTSSPFVIIDVLSTTSLHHSQIRRKFEGNVGVEGLSDY